MGHRRRASEFVGGDSRYGVSTLISNSPSKPVAALPLSTEQQDPGSPARRRGHAHRRSVAVAGHDLNSILQPKDANLAPQLACSASPIKGRSRSPSPSPATSTEDVSREQSALSKPSVLPFGADEGRPRTALPLTRPRVGFSEDIEYIPRPLSTVSSDTTSSASTLRGHSVGNSITSLISLGGVGSVSPRSPTPPTQDLQPASLHGYSSSVDTGSVFGTHDTVWTGLSSQSPQDAPVKTPPPSIRFNAPEPVGLPATKRQFRRGTLDRRRSEPSISAGVLQLPGVSAISLHEPVMSGAFESGNTGDQLARRSSRKKVKEWASAFLGRRMKEPRKSRSMILQSDMNTFSTSDPDTPDLSFGHVLDTEPDLDALFGSDLASPVDQARAFDFQQALPETDNQLLQAAAIVFDDDDGNHVIDLDAALGPYGTPSMNAGRRQMHSAGLGKRGLPGSHNRTHSLPAMTPFKMERPKSPIRAAMDDVFEEDEDDQTAATSTPESDDEVGVGIQIVDAVRDHEELTFDRGTYTRIPNSSFTLAGSPRSTRRSSVVAETIVEEEPPVDIVRDDEEPRSSSVTKSSDSSDTPTVMADKFDLVVPPPVAEIPPSRSASYGASPFPGPDYHGQHTFFDASRLGTSGSSINDSRTVSSFATGEHRLDMRTSVDDVPSLTSSRSTMLSGMHNATQRRDFSDRSGSIVSMPADVRVVERRRKRTSIVSLSKLVSHPFGESRNMLSDDQRPQTALPETSGLDGKKRKENRLSKLMFWRSKGDLRSSSSTK